jgi:single-strand DNA-binding protein
MVNKVTLIGHLGRDPEMNRLESGAIVGRFSVATTDSYKDKEGNWQNQTEWHDVIVWNEKAEHAEKFFKKGSTVYVEGKLMHRKYTDKSNIERYATEILALTCRSLREPGQSSGYGKPTLPTEEPANLPAQARQETPPTVLVTEDAPVKNTALPTEPSIHIGNTNRSNGNGSTNNGSIAPQHQAEPAAITEGGDNLPF